MTTSNKDFSLEIKDREMRQFKFTKRILGHIWEACEYIKRKTDEGYEKVTELMEEDEALLLNRQKMIKLANRSQRKKIVDLSQGLATSDHDLVMLAKTQDSWPDYQGLAQDNFKHYNKRGNCMHHHIWSDLTKIDISPAR